MQYANRKDDASEPALFPEGEKKPLVLVQDTAAKEVMAGAESILAQAGPSEHSSDDFDWSNPEEDSVILREQRATAAYRNRAGELIIRQRASWDDDRDTFLYISPENEVAFMEGLAKRARE